MVRDCRELTFMQAVVYFTRDIVEGTSVPILITL